MSEEDLKERAQVLSAETDCANDGGGITFELFVSTMHRSRHQGLPSTFSKLVDKVFKASN
jgi:hypothetical protein